MGDFDSEIERELTRVLSPVGAESIPAWRAPASGGFMKRILGGAGAAVGGKLLTGFAVTALAVVGAGAATEAALTGSLNPTDWGQLVVKQVSACKLALAPGHHGIGECVSDFAQTHGDMVSDVHASGPRHNGGKDKDGEHGQPSDTTGHGKPTPAPGTPGS